MGASEFAMLDRSAIEASVAAGRRLLVQGAMGLHVSDGLAGKAAERQRPGGGNG
jgi:hypothetical protein